MCHFKRGGGGGAAAAAAAAAATAASEAEAAAARGSHSTPRIKTIMSILFLPQVL